MFDSGYYPCSIGSPQLLIDDLPDASYISRLVEPITNMKIQNDDFQMDFVTDVLLPQIKTIIKQGKKSMFSTIPTIIRLIMDNYIDDAFQIMRTEIVPIFKASIQSGGQRKVQDVTDLFIEVCSMIPRDYRDDFVVDLVHKFSSDPDIKIRQLAVSLIPVVRDSCRVIQDFFALSKDKQPSIRASIVSNLNNYTFEENIINTIFCSAIHDPCIGVQQMAANMIGSVAPQMTKEFCLLLRNPQTVRNAFPSMSEIVAHSSFAEVFDSFLVALNYDKNDAALALLETVQKVSIEQEQSLYIRAAHELVDFSPFTWRLHSFAQFFSNKSDFIALLDPSRVTEWRTRYALLKQCIEFVGELNTSSLIRLAEIFSEDQIAYVRNESVNLWVTILKSNQDTQPAIIDRLMRGSWQKRIVLSKVIGIFGKEGFESTVDQLQHDAVENVRHCINSNI